MLIVFFIVVLIVGMFSLYRSNRRGLIIRLVVTTELSCLAWGLRPQMSTRLSKRQKRGVKRNKKGITPYKYYLERDEIIRRKINDQILFKP